MSLMKSLYIAPTLFGLVLSSTISFAQTDSSSAAAKTANKTPPAYGDNPNIFEVLAHKTSDKVVNTAEKVGDATERGVEKVKPKVNQAWDNITAKHTVDVPIEQKSLSQSSNNEAAPKVTQPPLTKAPLSIAPKSPAPAESTGPTETQASNTSTATNTSRPSTAIVPEKLAATPSAVPAKPVTAPTAEVKLQPLKPIAASLPETTEPQAHPTIVL